ncbi:RNA-directed DNA polymerase, eukaryota, nucleotide-binding alpha-beta plait domain protein [Tanacetum coccineum]
MADGHKTDDGWVQVNRRKQSSQRKSVFQRLGNNDRLSDVDMVGNISQSVFIMNFPNHTQPSDLWKLCARHGKVMDVFIAPKKSKLGKNFAFVRFIRISSFDILVENLCNIWIGSYKLFAGSPRFPRKAAGNQFTDMVDKVKRHVPRNISKTSGNGSYGSFAQVVMGRKVTNITNQLQNNIGRDKPKASEVKEDIVELSSGNYVVNTNETHHYNIPEFLSKDAWKRLCLGYRARSAEFKMNAKELKMEAHAAVNEGIVLPSSVGGNAVLFVEDVAAFD